MLLVRTMRGVETLRPLTLGEYLSLPDDVRAEIVDGVLRPMIRPSKQAREVQSLLTEQLRRQKPPELRVAEEEVVILEASPPAARTPDVVLFRAGVDLGGGTNYTHATDVLLAVEVVGPGTQTADRYEKPGEYARNEIPAFWRIELEPSIAVHTYRLVDGVYQDEGRYTRGGLIKDLTLPWLSIEVNDLLGDYA